MAVAHTNALELLGKHVTINFFIGEFPFTKVGIIDAVLISIDGSFQFLLEDSFYSIDEVDITFTA
jgi:hypothetical protein